jgi:hypothetical protein
MSMTIMFDIIGSIPVFTGVFKRTTLRLYCNIYNKKMTYYEIQQICLYTSSD